MYWTFSSYDTISIKASFTRTVRCICLGLPSDCLNACLLSADITFLPLVCSLPIPVLTSCILQVSPCTSRLHFADIIFNLLSSADIKGLKNASVIQEYQSTLLDALMVYTTTHYPNYPVKFGELLLRLSEVQRLVCLSLTAFFNLIPNSGNALYLSQPVSLVKRFPNVE